MIFCHWEREKSDEPKLAAKKQMFAEFTELFSAHCCTGRQKFTSWA
jgi:hypothetical protein